LTSKDVLLIALIAKDWVYKHCHNFLPVMKEQILFSKISSRRAIAVLALLFLCLPTILFAQKHDNVWYFGSGAGITFSTGTATPINNGQLVTDEGSACVSDEVTGDLLFYTDGKTIWNRLHGIMETGLLGHSSSTQSAVIIGEPGSSTRYYIFTSDQGGYAGPNQGINYSIVDMALNGGLGGVTTKNVLLLPNATEKLTAVREPNSCNTWIITHEYHSNKFYAFHLTPNGVEKNASVSAIGSVHEDIPGGKQGTNAAGFITASRDGKRLASCQQASGTVELFDLDPVSGIISNLILLPELYLPYGLCFSPDNSKLYVTEYGRGKLYQYDLSNSDPNQIISSEVRLNSRYFVAAIRPGPDNRLYISNHQQTFLGVVNNPNNKGAACNFVENAIDISPNICIYGLPNILDSYLNQPLHQCLVLSASIENVDTLLCAGDCASLKLLALNARSYKWNLPGSTIQSSTEKEPQVVCYMLPGRYPAMVEVSDGAGSTVYDTIYFTVRAPDTVSLSTKGVVNDTIGAEVSIPLTASYPFKGSVQGTLSYNLENLSFNGIYASAGERIDYAGTDINNVGFRIDGALRDTIAFARFGVYPLTDSCSEVTFTITSANADSGQCLVISSEVLPITICSGLSCGTPLISQFMRRGALPKVLPSKVAPAEFVITSDKPLNNAVITVYNVTGVPILEKREELLSKTHPASLLLTNIINGAYYVRVQAQGFVTTKPISITR